MSGVDSKLTIIRCAVCNQPLEAKKEVRPFGDTLIMVTPCVICQGLKNPKKERVLTND